MSRLQEIKQLHEARKEQLRKGKMVMFTIHPDDLDWLIEREERVEKLEKENAVISIQLRNSEMECHRYKQALKEIRKINDSPDHGISPWTTYAINNVIEEALGGESE